MKVINLKHQQVIPSAIKALSQGNLIIYPTETCYGLGADATNQIAVDQLLKFKTRREGKAFSVAVADQSMAEHYVRLNQTAKNLYQNFLPGPLTIVSKLNINQQKNNLARGIVSEFNTLGIRIPDHSFALNLVKQFGQPITATSANVSYQPPPYSLQQWLKQTPKKSQTLISLWINAGKLAQKPPSTVIDTTVDELTVLRQGSIKFNQKVQEFATNSEQETGQLALKIIRKYQSAINTQGLILGLQGELGAGKTVFAKGVAKALGINQNIKSPTFTLINEYPIPTRYSKLKTRNYLYHIDTWRMEKPQELIDLGFENMLKPGNVIIIEWAEKVANLIKQQVMTKRAVLIWKIIKVIDQHTRQWKFIANPAD